MQQPAKYYRHSGVAPLSGWVLGIALGGAGAIVLGAAYAYAIYYIPWVFLNVVLVAAYGGCVGLCAGLGAKFGKLRNARVVLLLALVVGVLAEYTGWVWWIYAASEQETFAVAPGQLWATMQYVAEKGLWSLWGFTPNGGLLYAIWVVEAVVVTGMTVFVAWVAQGTDPFCEPCGRWADQEDTYSPLEPLSDAGDFKARLEYGDTSRLIALKKLPDETSSFTKVALKKCPACQASGFLSVSAVNVTKDKDGKASRSQSTILENLIVLPDRYRDIKAALGS